MFKVWKPAIIVLPEYWEKKRGLILIAHAFFISSLYHIGMIAFGAEAVIPPMVSVQNFSFQNHRYCKLIKDQTH